MYGVPPPHSMLEEDSRYLRNALGTLMATYWLPNTCEYLIALLNTSAPEDAHYVLTVRRTYRGRLRRPEGLKLYASLPLSPMGYGGYCQRYGLGIPAPPVYMTTTKLLAQQPSRRRPARADMTNQCGGQGNPRQAYLDDSKDQSVVTN